LFLGFVLGKISHFPRNGQSKSRNKIIKEFRSSEVQKFRSSGVQKFRSSDITLFSWSSDFSWNSDLTLEV
jgi:hypothetical protein